MKPVLFNTNMVKAILDGRKTVTRRLVKRTPSNGEPCGFGFWREFNERDMKWYIKDYTHSCTWWPEDEYLQRFGKFKVGDIIYVRETWCEGYEDGTYIYKASDKLAQLPNYKKSSKMIYRPSIHMPKEAARIFLKVTDVRVERLQDITEGQVIKEGIDIETNNSLSAHRVKFAKTWDSSVDMKNHWMDQSWGANPWVWVIEFERIEKSEEE